MEPRFEVIYAMHDLQSSKQHSQVALLKHFKIQSKTNCFGGRNLLPTLQDMITILGNLSNSHLLNPFSTMFPFYTSLKHQKTGCIKWGIGCKLVTVQYAILKITNLRVFDARPSCLY